MIDVGSKAPEFRLKGITSGGEQQEFSLADLLARKKSVVLYFYPKDDTPGCTKEACDFRDRWVAKGENTVVLGVSPDDLDSHRQFQEKYHLNFPLLSDPDHRVCEAYGAWGEQTWKDKTFMGVKRSTFVIGADGTIQNVWSNVQVEGHAEKVLAAV